MVNRSTFRIGIVTAAVLLGFGIGVAVRNHWMTMPAVALQPSGTNGRTGSEDVPTVLADRTTENARLSTVLAKMSAGKRALWIATRAEGAEPEKLWHLLQLAKDQPELQSAIAARWATLDPRHMHAKLLQTDDRRYFHELFDTWSKSDSRGMFAAVLEARNNKQTKGTSSTHTAIEHLMRNAPEVGIEAMAAFGIEHYLPSMRGIEAWVATDPKEAANQIAGTLPHTHAGMNAMKAVGKAWGARDPETALAFAASLNDAMGNQLALYAMHAWAGVDADAALAFIDRQADSVLRIKLGQGLAQGLAEEDPHTALRWASDHLQSTVRSEAIGNIVKAASKKNIHEAAALVSNMNPGGAMNTATRELLQTWAEKGLQKNDAMYQWIESLDDIHTRDHAIEFLGGRLAYAGKHGLVAFVSGDYGHLASESMLRQAVELRMRQDPQSAVQWAKSLPEDRSAKVLNLVTQRRASN